MKISHILAAVTLLVATLTFHVEASATYSKKTFYGQVIDVNEDEEGASIVVKEANGLTQSVYAPRSRANDQIVERAINAQKTKTNFSISTQNF
ncbi:MAG: hypothetical protein V4654_13260 [Bdellovibrionota bacterium]